MKVSSIKYIVGFVLIGLGVACVVLCLVLHVQLNEVTTQGGQPNLDDYRLLQMFVPTSAPSATPADPVELARSTAFRINTTGAVGLLLIVTGIVVCVMGRAQQGTNRKLRSLEDQPGA